MTEDELTMQRLQCLFSYTPVKPPLKETQDALLQSMLAMSRSQLNTMVKSLLGKYK